MKNFISIALLMLVAFAGCKKVTDVTLQSELFLAVGKTAELAVTITPNNAHNQSVSWKTSNSDVATVENGIVTGISVGRAIITVTTEDGNRSATCLVTVLQLIEPEMAWVEGGTFTMGCTDDECDEYGENELPARQLTLSGFYIGKYVVTQKEWKAIMLDNPGYYIGDDKPVTSITFDNIQKFIKILSEVTGKKLQITNRGRMGIRCTWRKQKSRVQI